MGMSNLPDLPLSFCSFWLSKVGKCVVFQLWTLDSYVINFQINSVLGGVDPIVSIFGVCDAEADDKLSMKEIQGKTDCRNMLEIVGIQNTSITDEFSMIDKDQDGYVSMEEAYIAANNLDRKGPKKSTYSLNDMFF